MRVLYWFGGWLGMFGAAVLGTGASACCNVQTECDTCGTPQQVFLVDATTQATISDAQLSIHNADTICRPSNPSGYECNVPLGTHSIRAMASGYQSNAFIVTVTGESREPGCGECCAIDFDKLDPVTLALQPLEDSVGAGGAGGAGNGGSGGIGGAGNGGSGGLGGAGAMGGSGQ